MLSCLYMSHTCVIILCVSNLRRVFSKCSFQWHSAYFHSALYPSFRRKNLHWIFRKLSVDNFLHSAFPKIALPVCDSLSDATGLDCSDRSCICNMPLVIYLIGHPNHLESSIILDDHAAVQTLNVQVTVPRNNAMDANVGYISTASTCLPLFTLISVILTCSFFCRQCVRNKDGYNFAAGVAPVLQYESQTFLEGDNFFALIIQF